MGMTERARQLMIGDREYTKQIMEKVRRVLKLKKMTSKELAERLKICYATLCLYSNGERIMSAHRLKEIADILGVPLQELFPDDPRELEKKPKVYATIRYYNPDNQKLSEHTVELIANIVKDPDQLLFPANPEESGMPDAEPAGA